MFLNGITPPCYIEVYLPRQEIELACVCVLRVSGERERELSLVCVFIVSRDIAILGMYAKGIYVYIYLLDKNRRII